MLLPLDEELRRSYYEHRVFIFDFDGVILESVDARNEAFYDLFTDYGEFVCQQVLELHLNNPGIDRRDKILRCYQEILHMVPSEQELDQRVERFGEVAKTRVLLCPEVAGISVFMQSLESRQCYVVSVARQEEVRDVVAEKKLLSWFSQVYGGPRKKATIIDSILEQESIPPNKAVFIGDKISDYHAAQATGVHFYGRLPDATCNPFPDQIPVFTNFNQLYINPNICS